MWPSLDSRNTSSQYFSTGDWPEQLHSNPNLTLTLSRIRIGTRPDVIILRSHFTMTSTSSAHLICLCGAISAPGTLLVDPEIPISVEICYCNPCRRITGSLGVSFPALNSSPSPEILSKLTAYHSSQVLTRYFCSTCGCHCFLLHQERKKWYCLGGIIEPSPALGGNKTQWPKDTLKVSRHQCVLDTLDGGLAPLLLNLNGRSIPTWFAAPDQVPREESFDLPHDTVLCLPSKSTSTPPRPKQDSYLPAKCHCAGASLLIKRANWPSNPNPNP